MKFTETLREEVKTGRISNCLLFLFWPYPFLTRLYLEEYQIQFRGISTAIILALVVAKVVVILDKTPIGNWF
jgi:hypothetical protein